MKDWSNFDAEIREEIRREAESDMKFWRCVVIAVLVVFVAGFFATWLAS